MFVIICSGGAVHDADKDQGEDEGVRPAVRKIAQPFSRIFSYIIIVAHFLVHHSGAFHVLLSQFLGESIFLFIHKKFIKGEKMYFFVIICQL